MVSLKLSIVKTVSPLFLNSTFPFPTKEINFTFASITLLSLIPTSEIALKRFNWYSINLFLSEGIFFCKASRFTFALLKASSSAFKAESISIYFWPASPIFNSYWKSALKNSFDSTTIVLNFSPPLKPNCADKLASTSPPEAQALAAFKNNCMSRRESKPFIFLNISCRIFTTLSFSADDSFSRAFKIVSGIIAICFEKSDTVKSGFATTEASELERSFCKTSV